MRLPRLDFRSKLALMYVVPTAFLLLVFFVETLVIVRAGLRQELNRALNQDFATLELVIRRDPASLGALADTGAISFFRVEDTNSTVYTTRQWREAGLDDALPGLEKRDPLYWTNPDGDYFKLRAATTGDGRRYIVARDANEARVTLNSFLLTLLIGLPSSLLFAGLGGYWLAERALRPVGLMARQARRITAESLSARLEVPNPDDDFGQLATVFNETLARLEQSFEQLRRFTADASHQLRTPLATMRTVGEVGLRADATPEQTRDAIASLLEEVRRMSSLVDDLLTLTRAEAGQLPLRLEPVPLASLAEELRDMLEPLAEEKGIALAWEAKADATVHADPGLLRQAILNILDNGIKYTPEGGVYLSIKTDKAAGVVMLAIRDTGPGIPPAERDAVFRRFYRGRTGENAGHGTGLGLAVARWAVETNGGHLHLDEPPGGGCAFTLQLPLYS